MPSAKSSRSPSTSHSADQKLLRTKDVVIHRGSKQSDSCLCCGKRLVALPVFGFTIFSIGCLLGIGYYSIRKVTSSAYHTEGLIPSYVTAAAVSHYRLFFLCYSERNLLFLNYSNSIVLNKEEIPEVL